MYYGNSSASSQFATPLAAGEATFPFFDDFSGSFPGTKWTGNTSYGSISSGSLMVSRTDNSWAHIYGTITANAVNFATRARVYYYASTGQFGTRNSAETHYGYLQWSSGTTYIISTKDGSTNTTAATNIATDAYYIYELRVIGGTNVRAYKDDIEMTNSPKTTNPPNSSSMVVELGVGNTTTSNALQCDWVLIRNYTANEPTWGTWGSEEYMLPTKIKGNLHIKGNVQLQ
jgi:hypothetical protein